MQHACAPHTDLQAGPQIWVALYLNTAVTVTYIMLGLHKLKKYYY